MGHLFFPSTQIRRGNGFRPLRLLKRLSKTLSLLKHLNSSRIKFKQAPFEAKHQFAEALVAAKKVLPEKQWTLACKTLNTYLDAKTRLFNYSDSPPLITSYFEMAALLGGRLEEKNYRTFLEEFFKFSKTLNFTTVCKTSKHSWAWQK